MLTIEEIKKELAAGREVELECIDTEGFLGKESNTYLGWRKFILSLDRIIATSRSYNDDASMLKDARGMCITDSQLKYFRIKRPAPTFDDLIDSAANAIKKKLIVNLYIGPHYIEFDFNEHSHAYDMQEAKRGIDFINSLYTETFVIESVDDTLKIDTSGGEIIKITLANGEVLSGDYLDCLCDISDGFRFKILKGATVTQRRGEA
ncbi:hypothetical protein MMG00_11965 [Ignatzschineria rhizosphaerae]|uniref:Uncharacterized protein n=1 Tax=Ignatzschineria rhizosphaerae TaxID=2923279 RepID=A0ABY3X0S4_9GAMM|nr:hypothetical protein [Ignatzschineria rhizosphaerae]UNM95900.1 hypothetical protein MMG00_11965 [Ignatzschineria rhizosphaerae]